MAPRQVPAHPERICWGCDRHCPITDMACGEDKARAPHPSELFGDDWASWELQTTVGSGETTRRSTASKSA